MDKLGELREMLGTLSTEQQWLVIYHLLHDRMGDNPEQEAAICGPNGVTYAYIMPAQKWFERRAGAEREQDAVNVPKPTVRLDSALEIASLGQDPASFTARIDKLPSKAR